MSLRTILIAEDTDSNFALVSMILRKDYNLLRALNGLEAINIHSECNPDLILMDIQMPLLNGLDATRKIRETDKLVPIIAITAFAFDSDRTVFMKAGGTNFITKPIDPHELKEFIQSCI